MFKLRTTKTGSGKTAVQVVRRAHQQTHVVKHIGTARDESHLYQLQKQAQQYILDQSHTDPLFPEFFNIPSPQTIAEVQHVVDRLSFTKTYHTFAYEFFSFFYERNGFTLLDNHLLKDLSIMRIVEPASKLRSLALLCTYFDKTYGETALYEQLAVIASLKDAVEICAVSYAKKYLGFDFSLVFYDVTTLYWETHTSDEDVRNEQGIVTKKALRTVGFSKENKAQPQVLIGLVVNKDGYPIAVEMFAGKTFEGHTLIPVIKKLQEKHGIDTLTIVADAGMLSQDNIDAIKKAELHYIVGARLGNVSKKLLTDISQQIDKKEHSYYKANTDKGLLICDYTKKRAAKDKADRKKQLEKAQYQIDNPEKTKRRIRFVQYATKDKTTLQLNQELIERAQLQEGLKGYYTNLSLTETLTEKEVISRYKELWHVEKSFRIAKSDLEARPMFHHKQENITAHMVIVFVSLCITKSIELLSGYSIQRINDMIWKILDIEFVDTITGKQFVKRMDTSGNYLVHFFAKLQNQHVDKSSQLF